MGLLSPAGPSLLTPFLKVAIRSQFALGPDPSTDFMPELQGLPLGTYALEQTSRSLSALALMPFRRLQGVTPVPSPLFPKKPVPLVFFGPFRVLHVHCVGHRHRRLSLLPFQPLSRENGLDSSELFHRVRVPHQLRWHLYPPEYFALQGFLPGPSLSSLPTNPPLRLNDWRVLLSGPVGIYA